MNIDSPSQIRPCTGCQMCGAVCPTSAISIDLNEEGFFRPFIDLDKCINCSRCVRYCYKFDYNVKATTDLYNFDLFAAWVNNNNILNETTSGGIADILAKILVQNGYTCIGIIYDLNTNCAKAYHADSEKETDSFKGSKYIQPYTVHEFKNLVKHHKNRNYAVFGLPCHIYSINKFLEKEGDIKDHILIDLYCHGYPTLNLWLKYIKEIKNKLKGKKILSVNFRSKIRGWGNFYIVVVVEGQVNPVTYVSPRINDPFYDLFFSDTILNNSCYDCKLRSTLMYTDIRLGDFWGNCYVKNNKGVSAVTICSSKGQDIFEKIKPAIHSEKQEIDNFIPFQSFGKIYPMPLDIREILLTQLKDPTIPLETSLKYYKKSLSHKKRFILEAKNLIKLLPISLINQIKNLTYKIKK